MKFVSTFKNSTLIFVFMFGAFTGVIGYTYNVLSDRDKQILPFLGVPIVLGFFGLISSTISKEIDEKAKEQGKQFSEEKVKIFMQQVQKDAEELKQVVSEIPNLSEAQKKRIVRKISDLKNASDKYERSSKAAKIIAKWLDVKANKSILANTAFKAVSEANFNITEKYRDKFDEDIRNCINWLYASVLFGKCCVVEQERHASAIADIPGKYQAYETALKAIEKYMKEQEELKPELEKLFVTLEKMIDYLIEKLKTDPLK
ncbi:hypothetical protein [Nostoc sp.]|uniref:hypothetical protein n=1 Tax=Nostoc sp. TaxID=1180 RepID=UPI002FF8B769